MLLRNAEIQRLAGKPAGMIASSVSGIGHIPDTLSSEALPLTEFAPQQRPLLNN